MDAISTGTGLAALGFWLFIAGVVAGGVWDNIRKRDAQHETLRRVVESGQPIDADLTDKLLTLTGSKDVMRDLRIAGVLMLWIAPGLAIFGWVMSITLASELLGIMFGVSLLVLCIGAGLLFAARVVKQSYVDDAGGIQR